MNLNMFDHEESAKGADWECGVEASFIDLDSGS